MTPSLPPIAAGDPAAVRRLADSLSPAWWDFFALVMRVRCLQQRAATTDRPRDVAAAAAAATELDALLDGLAAAAPYAMVKGGAA